MGLDYNSLDLPGGGGGKIEIHFMRPIYGIPKVLANQQDEYNQQPTNTSSPANGDLG